MSLSELKNYIRHSRVANLMSVSLYFNEDPGLIRQKLQHWIRKGCVRRVARPDCCGKSCQQCDVLYAEIYEWVDA